MNLEGMDPDAITFEMEAALSSKSIDTVRKWVHIGLGIMDRNNLKPTRAQVERGMSTPYDFKDRPGKLDWEAAAIWIKRQDYQATDNEIKTGLSHPEAWIRQSWALRTDYIPTDEQISAGLKDEIEYVREAFLQRENITFNTEHIDIMIGFLESYDMSLDSTLAISATWAFHQKNVMFTEDQINRVMASSYYKENDDGPYIQDIIRTQVAVLASTNIMPAQNRKRVML